MDFRAYEEVWEISMIVKIIFEADLETGEVYDFERVGEHLNRLPDGSLKTKLQSDLKRSEATIMRILRSYPAYHLKCSLNPDAADVYELRIWKDGRAQNSLSLDFLFCLNGLRDLAGGVIFHGSHKLFSEDLKVLDNFDPNDETLAKIHIHT